MKKSSLMAAIGIVVVGITFIFIIRSQDLVIHLIAESANPKVDVTVQIDGKIVFEDSISSGAYFGKRIVVKDLDIGYHKIKILSKEGRVKYENESFFLFNRTTIVTYFEKSIETNSPNFLVWRKFGKFLPD